MAAKGKYVFEVITLVDNKPAYDVVTVDANTRGEAWDELRKAVDDSPMTAFEDVVGISLVRMPRNKRQIPELADTSV